MRCSNDLIALIPAQSGSSWVARIFLFPSLFSFSFFLFVRAKNLKRLSEKSMERPTAAKLTKQFVSQIKQLITNMFMHFISHQKRLSTCHSQVARGGSGAGQFYVQVLKYSIKSALDGKSPQCAGQEVVKVGEVPP